MSVGVIEIYTSYMLKYIWRSFCTGIYVWEERVGKTNIAKMHARFCQSTLSGLKSSKYGEHLNKRGLTAGANNFQLWDNFTCRDTSLGKYYFNTKKSMYFFELGSVFV